MNNKELKEDLEILLGSNNLIENNDDTAKYDGIIVKQDNLFVGECKECHVKKIDDKINVVADELLNHFRKQHDDTFESYELFKVEGVTYIQFQG